MKYSENFKRVNFIDCILIIFTLIALPIDLFAITAELFRELGGKPAILLLVLSAIMTLLMRALKGIPMLFPKFIIYEFLLILLMGFFAFSITIFNGTNYSSYFKSPVTQFVSHWGLFALFSFVVVLYTQYCRGGNRRELFIKMLPWAAVVHLIIFMLEAFDVIDDQKGLLSMFRGDGGLLERPTGLMSEPSYYGTYAALFGVPLLFINFYRNYYYRALGGLMLVTALSISAKTMFIVIFFQFFFWILYTKFKFPKFTWVFLALAITVTLTINEINNPFDVNENLSSAMRFGSNILTFNLITDGYGVLGLGMGQFHFFYKEEYAPLFLTLSSEAQSQFQLTAESRASTYNLFARILVETGFFGLLLFLDIIRRALKKVKDSSDPASQFSVLLIGGSVGFLMTQDTYFYPPLVIGLVLAFSHHFPAKFR